MWATEQGRDFSTLRTEVSPGSRSAGRPGRGGRAGADQLREPVGQGGRGAQGRTEAGILEGLLAEGQAVDWIKAGTQGH